eukprot:g1196.t1
MNGGGYRGRGPNTSRGGRGMPVNRGRGGRGQQRNQRNHTRQVSSKSSSSSMRSLKPKKATQHKNRRQQQQRQSNTNGQALSSGDDTEGTDESSDEDGSVGSDSEINRNSLTTDETAVANTPNREERHSQYIERTTSDYELQTHEQFIRIKSPDKKSNRRSSNVDSQDEEINTLKKDRFGFIVSNDHAWHHAAGNAKELKINKIRLENARLRKWNTMLKNGLDKCSDKVIKRRVRKGLPQPLRGHIWCFLSGAKLLENVKGDLYNKLQHVEVAPCETMIIADVNRTFRGKHVLFENHGGSGQERLFNVLRAVSVYDETLGYCSGMNFIVGMLLIFLNEKDAFYVFISLLKGHKYKLRSMYLPDMPGMMIALYTLDKLLEKTLPKIYNRFQEEHIEVHMFATTWIKSMFVSYFPIELVIRIWDIFFKEGWKIIYRVILGVLKYVEIVLLNDTYERICVHLNTELASEIAGKHDVIIDIALNKIKFTTIEMEDIEREGIKLVGEHGHLD